MECAVAAEGADLRIAFTAEFRLHDRDDQTEVESVRHAIGDVHRRHPNIEVHRQMEIHGVVLEPWDPVESATAAELSAASGDIDVLMGENEVDVAHVDAAQRGESESGSADPGQHASLSQRLRPLGEDW